MRKIILASTSPRRKEIFKKLGLDFEIQESNYLEDLTLPLTPQKLVEYLSLEKTKAVASKNPGALIIGADTIVVYKNKIIGKPKDEKEALKTLKMLNGKANEIITGVSIIDTKTKKKLSFHEKTKVFMQKMTIEEIKYYIKTKEPLDKAGSFAIQDIGAIFIKKIEGDFFSALGLPISRLAKELKKFGIKQPFSYL